MTTELQMLLWAVVLGLVHALATGAVVLFQHGPGYVLGPQDEQKPVSETGQRVRRAFANYRETFPFFAVAVLAAQALGRHDGQTALGAELYFWARLVYVPVYALGIPMVRTLLYVASLAGIVLVLLGLT